MKVTMEFNELNNLLSRYVQVGFMEAVRMYEPAQDMIRLTEVKAWLKMALVDYKTFKALVDKGAIRARKAGDAKNSPLYYSKKEIQQALASVGVMRAINTALFVFASSSFSCQSSCSSIPSSYQ